jgi:hypothetical protein
MFRNFLDICPYAGYSLFVLNEEIVVKRQGRRVMVDSSLYLESFFTDHPASQTSFK